MAPSTQYGDRGARQSNRRGPYDRRRVTRGGRRDGDPARPWWTRRTWLALVSAALRVWHLLTRAGRRTH